MLKDRALVVGDVVKRQPSDTASGTVVRTSTTCTLRPIYTDLPYHGSDPWPHKPEENEVTVSEDELQFQDIELGDHILYHDWVGEVADVFEEVTVRLSNGSVVRVQTAEDLEIPDVPTEVLRNGRHMRLALFLRQANERLARLAEKGPTVRADYFYPGQHVSTKKANLRLGTWLIGSYSPSVAPRGIVVDVRVFQLHVTWIAGNITGKTTTLPEEPWEMIEGDQMNDVKLFKRSQWTSSGTSGVASSQGPSMAASDYVKFVDVAGAAVKYSADSPKKDQTGVFRRIPRTMTQGFEMNTFYIRDTKTSAWVQWQDGSLTEESAPTLLPYLNVDDHDLWLGEICSLKSQETTEEGAKILRQVGVVQSVNAQERTARIRWFQDPQARVYENSTGVFVPGSVLGPLSDRESSVSVYEVVAYSALTKRRGDLVLVFPSAALLAAQTGRLLSRVGQEGTRLVFENIPDAAMDGVASSEPFLPDPRNKARWLGEVVDLGLDGLLTVRLGAADPIEDIRVPTDRAVTIVGGDDPDFFSQEGGSEDDDYVSGLEDEQEAAEETVEYEGGTRIDNDADDDAWMTDGEDDQETDGEDGDFSNADSEHGPDQDHDMTNGTSQGTDNGLHLTPPSPLMNVSVARIPPTSRKADPDSHEEYHFSTFPDMPPQFEVLEDIPPPDHHYAAKPTRLTATLLRRVRKEHAMLADALPAGIWVRTWSERLDLFRILIVGPRGTPYELAPFVIDVHLRDDYPQRAPEVYFHSWTFGVGRINPNLYEEGTVCLSVLGTWPEGEKHEAWNPERSSVLQVLVSLLGLVLVAEPYYSEWMHDIAPLKLD